MSFDKEISEDCYSDDSSRLSNITVTTNKKLFNESKFHDVENDEKQSLLLLANCVYVVTSTILHERKLIPKSAFKSFNVYGEIKGYLIDSNEKYGEVVAMKFKEVSDAIAEKTIRKFALIVELEDNPYPVEAFIWHFKFNSINNLTAELGVNGNKQLFTVKYKNMIDTCRQFCELFAKLRNILSELNPLPKYVTPSFRVAFTDSSQMRGYYPVKDFVKMNDIMIGKVRYPKEEIQLTFSSNYIQKENNRSRSSDTQQYSEYNNNNVMEQTRDYEESYENNEKIQKEVDLITQNSGHASTLSIRSQNEEDSIYNISGNNKNELHYSTNGAENVNLEIPSEDDFSLLCEPNIVSENELLDLSPESVFIQENDLYTEIQASPLKKFIKPMEESFKRKKTVNTINSKEKKKENVEKNLPLKRQFHFARVSSIKSVIFTDVEKNPKLLQSKKIKYAKVASLKSLIKNESYEYFAEHNERNTIIGRTRKFAQSKPF